MVCISCWLHSLGLWRAGGERGAESTPIPTPTREQDAALCRAPKRQGVGFLLLLLSDMRAPWWMPGLRAKWDHVPQEGGSGAEPRRPGDWEASQGATYLTQKVRDDFLEGEMLECLSQT